MDTVPFGFCDGAGFYVRFDGDKARILRDLAEGYGVHPVQRRPVERYKGHMAGVLRRDGRYLASLRSSGGAQHLLFLTRTDFAGVCIVIEKRLHGEAFHPRMVLVHMSFDDALFNDTVLEGELTRRGKDGRWAFLVSDALVHSGYRLSSGLVQRLEAATHIVAHQFTPDDHDPFALLIKPHFPVRQLRAALASPFQYGNVRGVSFRPTNNRGRDTAEVLFTLPREPSSKSGVSEDDDAEDDDGSEGDAEDDDGSEGDAEDDSEGDSEDGGGDEGARQPQSVMHMIAAFYTRRTSMPDVYELWARKDAVGTRAADHVAGVPSLVASRAMQAAFSDVKDAVHVVKLLVFAFNERLSKWVPIDEK